MTGEFELIERLKRQLGKTGPNTLVGIGDDCAVTRSSKHLTLLKTDALVEGVHFSRKWMKPEEVGYKAFAVTLSDIAAMGGLPLHALVSLTLSADCSEAWVQNVYRGAHKIANQFRVDIVGGNIAALPERFSMHVFILGKVSKPLLRSGARPGDFLVVTGSVGDAAGALSALSTRKRPYLDKHFPKILKRFVSPKPRIHEMLRLRKRLNITSAIDISDGFSSDLTHLARASHCGFEIDSSKIPISPSLKRLASELKISALDCALHGGEDYEILMTVRVGNTSEIQKIANQLGIRLTVIGKATAGREVRLLKPDGTMSALRAQGWDHLRRKLT